MLRNIHLLNIKHGADEARMLHLVRVDLARMAQAHGCIERKTWRFLNATANGQPSTGAMFLDESLWPSQKAADAFGRAERTTEDQALLDELFSGIEVVQTLRYVDDAG